MSERVFHLSGLSPEGRGGVLELLKGDDQDYAELMRLLTAFGSATGAPEAAPAAAPKAAPEAAPAAAPKAAPAAAPEAAPAAAPEAAQGAAPAAEGTNTSTNAIAPPPQPASAPLDCPDGYSPMIMRTPCSPVYFNWSRFTE